MNTVLRLSEGGDIDRSSSIPFRFEGRTLAGFKGDTIASALLANGIGTIGRSFKYHRPRGIFSAGIEEPNAILDLRQGSRHDPNARATIEPLEPGMSLRSIHALGTVERDWFAFIDRFHRFIPSAFYYKTFLWPNWRFYESAIRRMAGLGRLDANARVGVAHHHHATVDLCVVGAGPAGLAAAIAGVRAGKSVLIVDEMPKLGGSLATRDGEIDGKPASAWVEETARALSTGGAIVLTRSTAFGVYDDNEIAIAEHRPHANSDDHAERLWRVRARSLIIATGAIERPLLFADNDLPRIMLAGSGYSYLKRHALRLGERIIIATNNDSPYEFAFALRKVGAEVAMIDTRSECEQVAKAGESGIDVHLGEQVTAAIGSSRVQAVRLSSGHALDADFVFVSGGWTPSIHLYCQARGKPQWSNDIGAFVPGPEVAGVRVVGAACGTGDLSLALKQGHEAAGGKSGDAPQSNSQSMQWSSALAVPPQGGEKRVWVDFQGDVTIGDIELAVKENFASVEHLKRYTTLGMANDQGKTSNLNGLAVLAQATGREFSSLGLTTFRPPYAPVSMATIAGPWRGEMYAPVRRLPAENVHRDEHAHFREYGGILRPAWYGSDRQAIAEECLIARSQAIVFDGSSLGKIDVLGPDAAKFLDFISYARVSTLPPGRLRYSLMLTEGGVIFDDGVILRLAPDHFVVSCSSSHVGAVLAHLEAWRQDQFDVHRVFIHDSTSHWATMTIAGPRSRSIVESLELGTAIDDDALPHMNMREGRFSDRIARIARVSFIGERSYEISVPAGMVAELWQKARSLGAMPMGVEALSILRAEKGYIIVGQDTDGETMPHDIGFSGPREKRQDAFIGDRSLFIPVALRDDRRQLVGVICESGKMLAVGAHAIAGSGPARNGLGFITSAFCSPTLRHPIALALIKDGRNRLGSTLTFEHLGQRLTGKIVAPCFFDPEGKNLHA